MKSGEQEQADRVKDSQVKGISYDALSRTFILQFVSHLGALCTCMCVSHSEDSLSPRGLMGPSGALRLFPLQLQSRQLSVTDAHTPTDNKGLAQAGGHIPILINSSLPESC